MERPKYIEELNGLKNWKGEANAYSSKIVYYIFQQARVARITLQRAEITKDGSWTTLTAAEMLDILNTIELNEIHSCTRTNQEGIVVDNFQKLLKAETIDGMRRYTSKHIRDLNSIEISAEKLEAMLQ